MVDPEKIIIDNAKHVFFREENGKIRWSMSVNNAGSYRLSTVKEFTNMFGKINTDVIPGQNCEQLELF